MRWADFGLERFRVLQLELRSTQRGMATVLRLEAGGLRSSGPETREELLRQSATANPEQAGIWGELGVEELKRGMREEAGATLKTAREQQPIDSWTLRLEAMIAASQGDWRPAEAKLWELGRRSQAELRETMQLWPRELVPQQAVKGEIWECMGKGSEGCVARITFPKVETSIREERMFAEGWWEQLATLPEPLGEASAWFRRGVALAELSECGRAIPALERGLEPGAETAAYWLELCYAAEAQRAVERVGALGDQVAAHRLEGDFRVRVYGDAQSATEKYKEAIQLSPRDPGLLERLAQAYMSLGDVEHAVQAGRQALALDPRRRMTLRLLASIAMNEREYAGALGYLKQMLAMDANDAWTRVQMGIAYAQTGRPQEALHYLQPALSAGYPDERGALHATLAGVLRKLGREQEAQTAGAEASRLSNLFQQHAQTGLNDHQ
jgi:tetratricopeptide (TPR) repeat protein